MCGYGKVGKEVARVFRNEKTSFVVIESDEKACARATTDGLLCLNMNAANDEALKEAGIMSAKSLVAALGSDADNLYVTLSAKSLNPDIFVVARIDAEESEAKLKRAGRRPYDVTLRHRGAAPGDDDAEAVSGGFYRYDDGPAGA